ncbi:hypothetical protein [Streptomyces colonosanans]|uniref:Uncharacterized protein n=1 Tax=Streptomyces colonosanans TaxID=1428652 RepID=A0A1S2NVZ4_9ACTN|nr:hypothetical protein [Streptomyces colonosanans]OIJ85640.1 hypothetical protein BIV24_27860 [Streptomyces colonosanans]
MYHTTHRITAAGLGEPVILWIAPAPERQSVSARELLRNEYTTVPYLSSISDLVPHVLAAD